MSRGITGCELTRARWCGAVLLLVLAASLASAPARALDFSDLVLTYHENYDAEIASPMSPEVDTLQLGGMTSGPPGTTSFTGSAVRALLSDSAQSGTTSISGGGVVGSGPVSLVGDFDGLQISVPALGSATLISTTAAYELPGGGPVTIQAVLLVFFDPLNGGVPSTDFRIWELDSAIQNVDFIDLSGSAIETALFAGTPFTIELSVDPSLPSPVAQATMRSASFGDLNLSIPLSTLPAGGSFSSAHQQAQLFGAQGPMAVQVDMTELALYLREGATRFNIDVGNAHGTPSHLYAAAGKAGVWNTITAAHTLNRADGSVSPATVTLTALGLGIAPGAASDPRSLLGDYGQDCFAVPTNWALNFAGLENGDYEVILYAPSASSTPTGNLNVGGLQSPALPGDAGLALIQGTSYEVFLLSVTDGTLAIYGSDGAFQSSCIGVSGVQLEFLPPKVPALSPFGLAGLVVALAGLAGGVLITRSRRPPQSPSS